MYVGIDIGTSVVKAVAFDEAGRTLGVRREQVRLVTEGVKAEQDLDELYGALTRVTRAVVADGRPTLLAITGQSDGAWPLDADGRPLRRGISWMDGRAAGLVEEWRRDGTATRTYGITGNTLFPGVAAVLTAWLDREEPGLLDAAGTLSSCKDAALQRLTGLRATDVSEASVPYLDPRTRDYSPEVLEALGIAHRAHLLAPIADPLPTAPALGDEVVPAGTPVAAGPTDVTANAVGAGVVEPGDGLLSLGTSMVCDVLTDALDVTGEPSGFHFASVRPGAWYRVMAAMAGTSGLDWVLSVTGSTHDEVAALLDGTEPGAGGVRVLPYFAPSGERSPFVEPAARAEFTGVSLLTTRAELVRATCEGIAYAGRHLLEAAGLRGEVAVCGGGTGNPAWLRLLADVLGRPLRVAPGPETGARGAIIAAAGHLGTGLDPERWTRPEAIVEPDPVRAAYYAEAYADHLGRVAAARARWSGA